MFKKVLSKENQKDNFKDLLKFAEHNLKNVWNNKLDNIWNNYLKK